MNSQALLISLLVIVLSQVSIAQPPPCQSGPMEGYQGEKCNVVRIISPDGFVYTSAFGYPALKKWSLATHTVVEEFSMEGIVMNGFMGFSAGGRYLRFASIMDNFYCKRLFDTQTGKVVDIGKYSMYEMLPNNIALISDEKKKLMLYDMTSKKVKATLAKNVGSHIDVSADGNIIVWGMYDEPGIRVYDVSKGSIILKESKGARDMRASVSPDGKHIVWCGTQKNLITNTTSTNQCYSSNLDLPHFLFTPDSKTMFVMIASEAFSYGDWTYFVSALREYDLQTGTLKADHSAAWRNAKIKNMGISAELPVTADGQIYFPLQTSVVLADKADFNKQSNTLDLFSNIGATGVAQQQTKEDRAKHITELTAAAEQAFQTMNVTNVAFQHDFKMTNFDYDPTTGFAVVGNVNETGLFNINDGKFVATYSSGIDRPGLSVKAATYGFYMVAPGGKLIAQRWGEDTFLYNHTQRIGEAKGAAFMQFVSERYALAMNKSNQIGLYDITKGEFIVTYGKWVENVVTLITPDKTKILFDNRTRSPELIELMTGKVLYKLDDKVRYGAISDNFIFSGYQTANALDIKTGLPVTLKNWDQTRTGKKHLVLENYLIAVDDNGVTSIFDLTKMQYTSPMPLKLLHYHHFDHFGVFRNANKLFIATDNGSASFASSSKDPDYASAYTMDMTTGQLTPYRYHIHGKEAGKIYAAQQAEFDRKRSEQLAAENAGLPECMHNLKIKPKRAVEDKISKQLSLVVNFDCDTQNYQIRVYSNSNATPYSVPRWQMEADYYVVNAAVCSKCNGHGTFTETVNYSNTNVDNYSVYAPGGKVITTKSGSFQKTDTCPVCKGNGLVKQ